MRSPDLSVPFALCLALFLAGCAGSAPDPIMRPSAPADDAQPATTPEAASSTPVAQVTQKIHWEGTIPFGIWSCLPEVGCDIGTPGAYGSERFEDLTAAGRLVGGNLTLTWTAETPLTTEMSVGAYLIVPGCGDCNVTDLGPDVTGPSPLALVFAGNPPVPEGAQIHIWVYGGPYQVAGPAVAGTSGSQSFALDGAVTIDDS